MRIADLEGERLVMFRHGYDLRELTVAACRAEGFEPGFAVEGGEMDAVLGFVRAGLGVAVVPRMVAARSGHGLRVTPLARPGLHRTIALAHRSDVAPPRAARSCSGCCWSGEGRPDGTRRPRPADRRSQKVALTEPALLPWPGTGAVASPPSAASPSTPVPRRRVAVRRPSPRGGNAGSRRRSSGDRGSVRRRTERVDAPGAVLGDGARSGPHASCHVTSGAVPAYPAVRAHRPVTARSSPRRVHQRQVVQPLRGPGRA